jgi:anti-anti-sigma factor
MEIGIVQKSGITIASVSGRLDSATAPQAQEKLAGLIKQGARLVLDMHKCEYVSSAGLRVLLTVAKSAAKEDAKAVLSGLLDEIREVMEMTGFGGVFKNYSTNDEAIAALAKG